MTSSPTAPKSGLPPRSRRRSPVCTRSATAISAPPSSRPGERLQPHRRRPRAAGSRAHRARGEHVVGSRSRRQMDRPSTLHRLVRRSPLAECWPRPSVIGIVNVTPDSFSDGGENLDPAVAVADRAAPAGRGCGARRRRRRVDPPGRGDGVARRGVAARRAGPRAPGRAARLDRHVEGRGRPPGARAGSRARERRHRAPRRPELAGVVADAEAYVCLMHMQGEPRTMQVEPRYDDVVDEVAAFLEERLAAAVAAGIPGGARLPRPGDRLRQDAGPEPRAAPRPRADLQASDGRCSSGSRARARWRGCSATRPARVGSAAASVGAAVAAFDRGAALFRAHDVAPACRGARGCGSGRAGERSRDDRARRDRPARLPRRARPRAPRRPAVPRRRRARPRARAGGTQRRIEDAVDYRDVVARVRQVSDARAYHLLEALRGGDRRCAARRLARSTAVRVRVRKPDVVLDPPVEFAAVSRGAPTGVARSTGHRARPPLRETRSVYVGSRTSFGEHDREVREPARRRCCEVISLRASRRDRPGEPVTADDPLGDARRALLPEAEVDVGVGGHGGGDAAVLRQPDAIDVARVFDPVDARPHGRAAVCVLVVSGGIALS